ncbi:hypothetical protein OPQ81_005647 [Rhizoctonia solani]|nr:hypothetical protein OPQ81_005647 [Rhizoctonia solani]
MCWPGYSNVRPLPGQHDTVASEVTDIVECMNPQCIFSPIHSSDCRECSRTCIQEIQPYPVVYVYKGQITGCCSQACVKFHKFSH